MFSSVRSIFIACVTAAMPFAALAEKPAYAGEGPKSATAQQKNPAPRAGKTTTRPAQNQADPVVIMPGQPERVFRIGGPKPCPPGLAKKDPTCTPPGQVKKRSYDVGETVDWKIVHFVTRPGLYGLADAPPGQRYAIIDGRLVRIDRDTGRILSILRVVEAILD